ncbi:MAG: carboxylesterase family protein [Chitinophagaceae bacterium]
MKSIITAFIIVVVTSNVFAQMPTLQVTTVNGILEGTTTDGIRSFKGIPFGAPPVGALRWKEPQPVNNWNNVRKADKFGPRAMQRPLFSDMNFRSDGMSEDCLYLNVWTPARSARERLPVMVYFYGGGFVAGDGSEYRYDGEALAKKGIVTLTVNYRLTVFGFLAHPELTEESSHHASGNYGLLDQYAALAWVQKNIAAFGGDPKRVTIAGESAGSFSVSAQMASPLSRNMISGAIGESGSLLGPRSPVPLSSAEETGKKFMTATGAASLADLRKMPADAVLEAVAKNNSSFPVCIDGYFLNDSPNAIFADSKQAKVPLLVGWNSEESGAGAVMGREALTKENFEKAVRRIYGDKSPAVLEAYQVSNDSEVEQTATDLASDRFIGLSTWKWCDIHATSSGKSVYRYLYQHPRPAPVAAAANAIQSLPKGAVHSAEIEYALGNLSTNTVFAWTEKDRELSEILQGYFSHFIKTGDPNGQGLVHWPAVKPGVPAMVMHLDVTPVAKKELHRDRYLKMQ